MRFDLEPFENIMEMLFLLGIEIEQLEHGDIVALDIEIEGVDIVDHRLALVVGFDLDDFLQNDVEQILMDRRVKLGQHLIPLPDALDVYLISNAVVKRPRGNKLEVQQLAIPQDILLIILSIFKKPLHVIFIPKLRLRNRHLHVEGLAAQSLALFPIAFHLLLGADICTEDKRFEKLIRIHVSVADYLSEIPLFLHIIEKLGVFIRFLTVRVLSHDLSRFPPHVLPRVAFLGLVILPFC